jgi:serine/threonine protein phosphatase 1
MCSRYYYSGDDLWLEPQNGGATTEEELRELSIDDRKSMVEFLASLGKICQINVDGKDVVFVHAGINPEIPISMQSDVDLVWIRDDFFGCYKGADTFVIGHTPVQYLDKDIDTPLKLENNILMLDTGSYYENGRISCVDVKSLFTGNIRYWQSTLK